MQQQDAQPNDPDCLNAVLSVSRETSEQLVAYVELLTKWQRVQNLVSEATLSEVWSRHILDSIQSVPLALDVLPKDETCNWADLGTGAGLPGLVVAIVLTEVAPKVQIHLVESNQRKVAFLRTVARELGLAVKIHGCRVDHVAQSHGKHFDLVSARALANLDGLLEMSLPLLKPYAWCLFHKGQEFSQEVDTAKRRFEMTVSEKPSITSESGRLLLISDLKKRA